MFSALTAGAVFAPKIPGVVRQQVRGATYPPLAGPLNAAKTAEILAARAEVSASPTTQSADVEMLTSTDTVLRGSKPSQECGHLSDAKELSTAAATTASVSTSSAPTPALSSVSTSDDSAGSAGDVDGVAGADSSDGTGCSMPLRSKDPVLDAAIRGSVRAAAAAWPDDGLHASAVRAGRFERLLLSRLVDIGSLRQLSWAGVPTQYRFCTWQMLLGYCPLNRDRQLAAVAKKRQEYQLVVSQYFSGRGRGSLGKSDAEQALLHQVLVDVPRTCPEVPLVHTPWVQRSLERVLYLWALRHPASGYVQGIDDLAAPLYAVFLSPWAGLDGVGLESVDPLVLADVEGDVYWCLTKLLDGIQDHFTPSQPGIQRMIFRLRELVHRIDEVLVRHLESSGVEFVQFAFRWMNCLLMRELPFRLVPRMWDTCLAERDGFDGFHVYLCAALLLRFAAPLKAMRGGVQEIVQFLQHLPTASWGVSDVEELLSQAFVYKSSFESAPAHVTG